MPVSVRGPSASSKAYTILNGASTEGEALPLPEGGNQWVKLNPGQTGVYRVKYSAALLAKLVPQVQTLETVRVCDESSSYALYMHVHEHTNDHILALLDG